MYYTVDSSINAIYFSGFMYPKSKKWNDKTQMHFSISLKTVHLGYSYLLNKFLFCFLDYGSESG